MKIPRPKEPETEFRRKRAPPPQATKLLTASLLTGLVFMAVLAVVFIPPYLNGLNRPTTTLLQLTLDTTGASARIEVSLLTVALNITEFNATLTQGNATVASLPQGLSGVDAGLSFTDANHNGLLDTGDYFTLPSLPQATYHFEVWQVDAGSRVGALVWTGSVP